MKIKNYKDGTFSIELSKTDAEIKAMSDQDLVNEFQRLSKTYDNPLILMMIEGELNRRELPIPYDIDKNMLDELEKGLAEIGEIFLVNLGGEDPAVIAKKVREMIEEK